MYIQSWRQQKLLLQCDSWKNVLIRPLPTNTFLYLHCTCCTCTGCDEVLFTQLRQTHRQLESSVQQAKTNVKQLLKVQSRPVPLLHAVTHVSVYGRVQAWPLGQSLGHAFSPAKLEQTEHFVPGTVLALSLHLTCHDKNVHNDPAKNVTHTCTSTSLDVGQVMGRPPQQKFGGYGYSYMPIYMYCERFC